MPVGRPCALQRLKLIGYGIHVPGILRRSCSCASISVPSECTAPVHARNAYNPHVRSSILHITRRRISTTSTSQTNPPIQIDDQIDDSPKGPGQRRLRLEAPQSKTKPQSSPKDNAAVAQKVVDLFFPLDSTPEHPQDPQPGTIPRIGKRKPRADASNEDLEEELRAAIDLRRNVDLTAIKHILNILISDRKLKPGPQHYEALLFANCSPEEGSAENVEHIIDEMVVEGVEISGRLYIAALHALAIHPSVHLTLSILSDIKSRQLLRTPFMTEALLIALVRTDQIALAEDLLRDINYGAPNWRKHLRTYGLPVYIHMLILRAYAQEKDYDAVIRHIYELQDHNSLEMEFPSVFWAWLLEQAARDGDGWVTGLLWQDWAEKMRVTPTRATCVDVLTIAARDGIPWLAESARDVIEYCDWEDTRARTDSLGQDTEEDEATHISSGGGNIADLVDFAPLNAAGHTAQVRRTQVNQLTPEEKDPIDQAYEATQINRDGDGNTDFVDFSPLNTVEHTVQTRQPQVNQLTPEEEDLIDQAYAKWKSNREVSGATSEFEGRGKGVPDSTEPDTISCDRATRQRQVKPGNMWPHFTDIEGFGSPRVDPWSALGPRSRPIP